MEGDRNLNSAIQMVSCVCNNNLRTILATPCWAGCRISDTFCRLWRATEKPEDVLRTKEMKPYELLLCRAPEETEPRVYPERTLWIPILTTAGESVHLHGLDSVVVKHTSMELPMNHIGPEKNVKLIKALAVMNV